MLKTMAFVALGLVAGLVVATWWQDDARAPAVGEGVGATATDDRLAGLERALRVEQERGRSLERALSALEARVATLTAVAVDADVADRETRGSADDTGTPGDTALADDAPPGLRAEPPFGPRSRFGLSDDDLVARFVSAGIAADRAQWIVQRTEELRMEALQTQYEAARGGDPVATRASVASTLRSELGDADFERYLTALGRPTTVYVRDVLSTSPGAQAGFQAGDQIVAYGGERVYDMSDVNRLVLDGEPGQMVQVEVLRDGQSMQLYVPRGPIGITGGGPGFRRGP